MIDKLKDFLAIVLMVCVGLSLITLIIVFIKEIICKYLI